LSVSGDTLYLFVLFIAGLYYMYTGLRKYLFLQKIEDTPVSKVGSAPAGLVELAGRARFKEPEKSPVSNAPSAYWRITGEYFYQSGKASGWKLFYTAESENLFYIQDDTGEMLVMPEGARIEIPSDVTYLGYISEHGWLLKGPATMDGSVLKFIESLDADAKQLFRNYKEENIRVTEYIIRENEPIFVLGTATPADGTSGPESQDLMVVRKGNYDSTLYITDSDESNVIGTVSSSMYLRIFGGFIVSAICLYLILVEMGV
jgi:hypothetical protein